MFRRTQQQGVALITVLLIVAVLLAVTSRLMATHSLVINQNQNTFEQDQALQYALGAEELAKQALFEDFTRFGPDQDHLQEVWAQEVLPFELDEGGFVEAQLEDLHGCFNLNGVVGGDGAAVIERGKQLMTLLNLPPQIVDTWKDWIDQDDQITGFGAEDSEYLINQVPYRTPNLPVTHLSELNLLQGVDREQRAILRPHICLLPDLDTLINVNTATAEVLASLDRGLTAAATQEVVATERAYTSVADFVRDYPQFEPVQNSLATTSQYFQLHAQAQVGETSVTLLSLLRRDTGTGQVTVLSRDFGRLFRSNLQLDVQVET